MKPETILFLTEERYRTYRYAERIRQAIKARKLAEEKAQPTFTGIEKIEPETCSGSGRT